MNRTADPKRLGRLLCLLIEQKIECRVVGSDLVAHAPENALTPEVIRELRRFKPSLIEVFRDAPFPVDKGLS